VKKIRLVALEEIRRTVFKKSFILVLLSLPLFIGMMIAPGIIMESLSESDLPIGYVDLAGVLAQPRSLPESEADPQIMLTAFVDESAAAAALEAGEIQAFYILREDYQQSRKAELVYREEPGSDSTRAFYDFLQLNLLDEFAYEVAWRAADRSELTIRNPEGTRLFPEGAPTLGSIVPLALGMAFGGLMMMGAGSLMSGLIDEKSNRTMEVIATSISPSRLVTGKLIGIITINFIQLTFWILVGAAAIWLAGDVFGVEWFQNPNLDWPGMLAVAVVSVPGYVFASALMFTLGATVVGPQEGQAIGPLLFMVAMIPIYSLVAIANNPHGALSVALTLLPMTSILTVGMRNMLTVVPTWQIGASVALQTVCAVGAVWLAGKAFRLGMLRYGKRLRLREIVRSTAPQEA
jgi:ABC-2 type transport system permease protein